MIFEFSTDITSYLGTFKIELDDYEGFLLYNCSSTAVLGLNLCVLDESDNDKFFDVLAVSKNRITIGDISFTRDNLFIDQCSTVDEVFAKIEEGGRLKNPNLDKFLKLVAIWNP